MIFPIRQLQEKCQKQCKDLFQMFLDPTKNFDTINLEAFWLIIGKLDCLEKIDFYFKTFHHNMKTTLNIWSKFAKAFTVGNGVKRRATLASSLFALFASMDSSEGVYIQYRTTVKLFNIKRFTSSTKTMRSVILELLYADDVLC